MLLWKCFLYKNNITPANMQLLKTISEALLESIVELITDRVRLVVCLNPIVNIML